MPPGQVYISRSAFAAGRAAARPDQMIWSSTARDHRGYTRHQQQTASIFPGQEPQMLPDSVSHMEFLGFIPDASTGVGVQSGVVIQSRGDWRKRRVRLGSSWVSQPSSHMRCCPSANTRSRAGCWTTPNLPWCHNVINFVGINFVALSLTSLRRK